MKLVACPACGSPSPFSPENRWRPFCSERCRTNDLGAWASESYRIPVAEDAKDDSTSRPGEDTPA